MNDSSLRDHRLLNIVLILKAIFPITKKFKMAMPMITRWEDRTFFGNDPIIRTDDAEEEIHGSNKYYVVLTVLGEMRELF